MPAKSKTNFLQGNRGHCGLSAPHINDVGEIHKHVWKYGDYIYWLFSRQMAQAAYNIGGHLFDSKENFQILYTSAK